MLAIDTNLIVRYLTRDHPAQTKSARALIEDNDVFVSITVFLEVEWVLRSLYGFAAGQVASALTAFAGLPTVSPDNPVILAQALSWMAEGMEFADALHLASARECEAFVSFDQKLAKIANRLGDLKVRSP